MVPNIIAADSHFGAVGEFYVGGLKAEVGVNFLDQFAEHHDFIFDLLSCTKDMGVVLRHARDTHDSMQGTSRLMSHARAKLRHTKRKFPIAFDALVKDLNVTRTVHGLQSIVWSYASVMNILSVPNLSQCQSVRKVMN